MGKPQAELEPFREELQNLRKALGNRIRELRKGRGWSQEQFSAHAHVHRTFAGALERGEKNLSFHALVLISRSFGITVSQLLEGLETGRPASKRISRPQWSEIDPAQILEQVTAVERAAAAIKDVILAHTGTPHKGR